MNVRPETIKLLEESTEGKLLDIGLSNNFLNIKSKGKKIKNKQVRLPQTKKFLQSRKQSTKEKLVYEMRENI